MTAVLGILNKHAVAIAADSAVTITGSKGHKISNTANKIFMLSHSHPVGVALYSSAQYMGTPWEIIIKLYRKKLQNRSFDTLKGYVNDFMQYLRKEFAPTKDDKNQTFKDVLNIIWAHIENESLAENGGLTNENVDSFVSILNRVLVRHSKELEGNGTYDDFKSYSQSSFERLYGKIITSFCEEVINTKPLLKGHLDKSDFRLLFGRLIYLSIVVPNKVFSQTGLVFVGYGEKEYFPAIEALMISFSFGARMRYHFIHEDKITKDADAGIYPFAQHDVIDTIIEGIEPSLERQFEKNSHSVIGEVLEAVAKVIATKDRNLADQIANMDTKPILKNLRELNRNIKKRKYIDPLLETVASFSKEELADMAESMIALTSLKRKMTSDEESVGGPVDVAIISKVDGFVWIHRKQYFDKDINIDFLINKLKSHECN